MAKSKWRSVAVAYMGVCEFGLQSMCLPLQSASEKKIKKNHLPPLRGVGEYDTISATFDRWKGSSGVKPGT